MNFQTTTILNPNTVAMPKVGMEIEYFLMRQAWFSKKLLHPPITKELFADINSALNAQAAQINLAKQDAGGLELITTPHDNLQDLLAEMAETEKKAFKICRKHLLLPAAASTLPSKCRYSHNGTHFHFSSPSFPSKNAQILQAIQANAPIIAALTASSAFTKGLRPNYILQRDMTREGRSCELTRFSEKFNTFESRVAETTPYQQDRASAAAIEYLNVWNIMRQGTSYTPVLSLDHSKANTIEVYKNHQQALLKDSDGKQIHIQDAIIKTVEMLWPLAKSAGLEDELTHCTKILDQGTSLDHQVAYANSLENDEDITQALNKFAILTTLKQTFGEDSEEYQKVAIDFA